MSPRVLMLHPDRRLERLCDDVVHLRRAYRRRPDPAVLGPIARKAGIPAGTFIDEMRRLRFDPGPDGWRGLAVEGRDLSFTPFAVTIGTVGPIVIDTGCPIPGGAAWDWGILALDTGALPRLSLYPGGWL